MIGRVHWLLWNLTPNFKARYKLAFDYFTHSYCFTRMEKEEGHKISEIFTVIRTSKKAFRVSYANLTLNIFDYFSAKTSSRCAFFIEQKAEIYRELTQQAIEDKQEKKPSRSKGNITQKKRIEKTGVLVIEATGKRRKKVYERLTVEARELVNVDDG